ELQGADLRAADLTGANLEQLQSIAGADFTLAQGLSEETRAMLCSRSAQELGTWNAFTRSNTGASLGCPFA
ncbi:MAG: pentapeptide repeat-containing protein, partial [Microcystaceae cyanobacterium]